MTQPLAILNVEELHWLGDLGLPNQRRWLNHRTLGDEHRRTFPSAATDSNTRRKGRETGCFLAPNVGGTRQPDVESRRYLATSRNSRTIKMPKNLFISWSGPASHRVAILLYTWLPRFVQSIEPFLSSKNIRKGARWFAEVSAELSNVNFGIICMTPDNLNAPWLLFEAGALSKSLGQSRVTPLMINVSNSDLQGPLAEFNNTALTKEDFKQLIESANAYLGAEGIRSELLDQTFEIFWPLFEKELKDALVPNETDARVPPVRSTSDMLDELLQLTRDISQQLQIDRAEIKESSAKPSDSVSSSDFDESMDKEKVINVIDRTSHELRSAIVGIRGNASFLRSRFDQLSRERVDTKLNDILTDCELLLLQVEELNYVFGNRTTPRRSGPMQVFRDVVLKTINQLKPLLTERGVQFSQVQFRREDIERVRVEADRFRLQHVIFNLLLNAISYGEDDPAKFTIKIVVDETPQHFIVTFQDWGIGIPEAEVEKVFEYGFRGRAAISKSTTGVGFGLSVARSLMREMGGDLVLGNKSKPTEFKLLLPKPVKTSDTSP